jgi:ElaB/YqjD/DUF883 family membrane-anchored ribosome-binding protein
MANNIGQDVNRAVDQAQGKAHEKIDRAASAARPAVERTTERAHDAVDRMADRASYYADTLDRKGEELRHAQAQAMDSLRTYVNEHPVAALSIAVASGFLLSRIISGR